MSVDAPTFKEVEERMIFHWSKSPKDPKLRSHPQDLHLHSPVAQWHVIQRPSSSTYQQHLAASQEASNHIAERPQEPRWAAMWRASQTQHQWHGSSFRVDQLQRLLAAAWFCLFTCPPNHQKHAANAFNLPAGVVCPRHRERWSIVLSCFYCKVPLSTSDVPHLSATTTYIMVNRGWILTTYLENCWW